MPRRDLWQIVTLREWLGQHPAEDVQRAKAQIFGLRYRVADWFNGFLDQHGSMLLLTDGTTILGLSHWRFPSRTEQGDGGVFGDIGLIPNLASATAARGLIQQTVVQLRAAARRHKRDDLHYACMHVRIDDQRLLKLCLEARFVRRGILTNRFEDFGSFVETYMLHLPFPRPH